MSKIVEMIKKEQEGIVLVNKDLAICYNGKEFNKELLENQKFEEFILSVTDASVVSVRNHILEEDKIAVMIIGDLEQTLEEYFILFCMFFMLSIKPDDEIISSLTDINLEEHEILDELFNSITPNSLENISNKQEMFKILEESIFEIIERQFFDENKNPSTIFPQIIKKRDTIVLRGFPDTSNNYSKDEALKKQLEEIISKIRFKQEDYYKLFAKLKNVDISTSEKFRKIIQVLKKIQISTEKKKESSNDKTLLSVDNILIRKSIIKEFFVPNLHNLGFKKSPLKHPFINDEGVMQSNLLHIFFDVETGSDYPDGDEWFIVDLLFPHDIKLPDNLKQTNYFTTLSVGESKTYWHHRELIRYKYGKSKKLDSALEFLESKYREFCELLEPLQKDLT